MELKDTLVQLRKEHGLSQLQLAEKLNVSRQAISKWEVGATLPTTANLISISQIYAISVDDLMNTTQAVTGTQQETSSSSRGTMDKEQEPLPQPSDLTDNTKVSLFYRNIIKRVLVVSCCIAVIFMIGMIAIIGYSHWSNSNEKNTLINIQAMTENKEPLIIEEGDFV